MSRSSNYTQHEDVFLVRVYMEISQDPITGVYQSADRFWSRVEEAYNASISEGWEMRSQRSLQSRIQTIEKATRKLHGCIRQIENLNPNGASDQDILDRAKMLFLEDPKFKNDFKFDHVWNIVKNFEKFKDHAITPRQLARKHSINYLSSESDTFTPESQASESAGLSQFSLNLHDEVGGSSSKQPGGVKKAKLKKKNDEKISSVINSLKEENRQIMEMLKKSSANRQQRLEIQNKALTLQELQYEDKILMRDLNAISDSNVRAYYQAQQARIIQKKGQFQQPTPSTFGEYFNNLGGDGADILEY